MLRTRWLLAGEGLLRGQRGLQLAPVAIERGGHRMEVLGHAGNLAGGTGKLAPVALELTIRDPLGQAVKAREPVEQIALGREPYRRQAQHGGQQRQGQDQPDPRQGRAGETGLRFGIDHQQVAVEQRGGDIDPVPAVLRRGPLGFGPRRVGGIKAIEPGSAERQAEPCPAR